MVDISTPVATEYCVVVHYAEIGLKGQNRSRFENQLKQNIKRALKGTAYRSVEKQFGRFLIYFSENFRWRTVMNRLKNVFGVAYFAPAIITQQNMNAIIGAALSQMVGEEYNSFRVTTKRSQKLFPLSSQEVSTQVGAEIQKQYSVKVDLTNPDKTCYIEIFDNSALVYSDRIEGPGGLPVGVSEKAVSLFSAGIDSPLASWKIMKRGVTIIFVHFHSVPATTPASIKNAERLVELLTHYQYKSKLYLVPFLPIQQQIMVGSPPDLRVLLYRRSMFHLAERIAHKEGATALITGENVAQVASQTLSNIRAINQAVTLPVLRPLAGEDKKDIIDTAKRLGTYEISIEPYEDCCSLYVPKHPETCADLDKLLSVSDQLQLDSLYEEAVQNAEIRRVSYPGK